MIERLDNPSTFIGWAAILVGGVFLLLSIFLLANFPLSEDIESTRGVVERVRLRPGGKGSDTLLVSVDGKQFCYSGFWSEDVSKAIVKGSEVAISYYQAFDGGNKLVSLSIGNVIVLSKFQSLSGRIVFPSVGGLLSLFLIFVGFRDLHHLRHA
ncbi:hypothetical protein OQJ46_03485 [Microbulbifer thermotolerans]|uniref:DUF3592 domain-containing protein n=1 Tax=Microbulbifer thermotolerans TaxID=252514 RepID=A0AB35I2A6_MICTH|nr:hypothetical protein [Microbulbifer thermotolerans]MCX2781079.1 hypothetical protein [Microbulbifer thermotolerans]MCX2782051.1 hypothetical protein [Microbulbifer thermotolerans]MCX2796249.1 hypothetical protein [Microbulbifer thermotolerans]MCX2803276.1 hypothetical protein [Microbulbifer thermotolerans]MCX2806396.1 hypothetical protein [Microbulbifer thermotolerans]